MVNKKIKLDGKRCGFGAAWYDENGNDIFIRNKDGSFKLFKNKNSLVSWMINKEKIINPSLYEIFIDSGNGFLIPYDEIEKVDNHYEWYSDCNELFLFYEEQETKVLQLGYFVFEKPRQERIPKEEGKQKSKKLYQSCKYALQELLLYPNAPYALDHISSDEFGNICGYLRGNTGQIHICKNIKLIEMNKDRKEKGVRCLPFERDIDIFSSIYVFITRDFSEPNYFETEQKLALTRDVILDILQQEYPDTVYKPVTFYGTISL